VTYTPAETRAGDTQEHSTERAQGRDGLEPMFLSAFNAASMNGMLSGQLDNELKIKTFKK